MTICPLYPSKDSSSNKRKSTRNHPSRRPNPDPTVRPKTAAAKAKAAAAKAKAKAVFFKPAKPVVERGGHSSSSDSE
eukprot:1229274-Pyramimonas_sp.AAC.1